MNDNVSPSPSRSGEYEYTPARRSSRKSSGGWLKGLVAVAVVAIVAGTFLLWPANMAKALQKGMDAQQAAKSATIKGKMTVLMNMGGTENKMDMPLSVVAAEPNKMAMSLGDSSSLMAMKMVSDGTNLWLEMPMLKMVIQSPAPKDMKDLAKASASSPLGGGKGMMPGQMSKDDIAEVRRGLPRGNAWYKSLSRPDGTRPATVVTKDGTTMVLWLDAKTGLCYQMAIDMTEETMNKMADKASAGKTPPPPAKGTPGAGAGMSMRMLCTFSQMELNGKVDESLLKYKVPSGFQVKKVKSLDELRSPAAMFGG